MDLVKFSLLVVLCFFGLVGDAMTLLGMAPGVGAALLGNIAGGILGKSVSSAMDLKASKELIKEQLNAQKDLFQYENENKHQFEVGDLKAAGLNPILSATNGSAIGVGGVSAPNWSSDDDVFGPSSAKALQLQQMSLQDRQVKVSELLASGELEKNRAQANLFQTESNIKMMKADSELANIIADTASKTAGVKLSEGKFLEALSAVRRNDADAKDKLESAIGRNISNYEEKMFKELLDDPNIKDTPTYHALVLAKGLKLSAADRYGLVLAINAQKFRPKEDKVNDRASSGKSIDDHYDSLFEYGGVRE